MHRVLTTAAALQALPNSWVAVSLLIDSVLVGIFWLGWNEPSAAVIVAAGVLIANFANWLLLRRLVAQGYSYGPEKPSALALGAAIALIAVVLGLFGASLAVTLLVVAAVSVVAYYATWIEPFALGVTRERITARDWHGGDGGKPSLRVLHVADLHVERTTPRERDLNAQIEALQPDLIVFSGDFVSISFNRDEQSKADIRAIISEWEAPLGVYCVPGTPVVEPLPRVLEFVEGLDNLTLLANRWVTVETGFGALHILGMVTTHDMKTDRETLERLMQSAPDEGFKLLLIHTPDIGPEAGNAGIDLYLCGHTHGGQIRLPIYGALLTSSFLGRRFAMGRHEVGNMTLYTSRGIGLEGHGAPRARFLCPPEVILWEIAPGR